MPHAAPLPASAVHRDQYPATVVESTVLCREHWRLVVRVAAFPPTAPGQFVQLCCRDLSLDYNAQHEVEWVEGRPLAATGTELMRPLAFLRRPFSLAGRRDVAGGVELEIIHRVVGTGTAWLSALHPGDGVDVLGPLGNRFRLPAENEAALLVGGGVGIPPMLYLASQLAGRKGVAFCGALTRDLLPLTLTDDAPAPAADQIDPLYNVAEFARHGLPAVITTDDGSYGFRGFVTQALERYLERFFPMGTRKGVTPVVYTCGPEGMMKRVAEIAALRDIECQVAVERAMACGMGTCQSCCIRLKRDPARDGAAFEGKDWIYKLACTDGPVFLGKDLLW